ncbi:hypothetical protein MKZ38_006556 [Zalerion maritima]|uniref:Uncharacterized protein n=1 Tax=Zalerion maritima TaxID=339359 RepID=A0AAD5RYS0_9PEZI|nr:hypothetical protein MKZ38_006556 [Zalerion maritima]
MDHIYHPVCEEIVNITSAIGLTDYDDIQNRQTQDCHSNSPCPVLFPNSPVLALGAIFKRPDAPNNQTTNEASPPEIPPGIVWRIFLYLESIHALVVQNSSDELSGSGFFDNGNVHNGDNHVKSQYKPSLPADSPRPTDSGDIHTCKSSFESGSVSVSNTPPPPGQEIASTADPLENAETRASITSDKKFLINIDVAEVSSDASDDVTADEEVAGEDVELEKEHLPKSDDCASVWESPEDYWTWDMERQEFFHIDEDGSRVVFPDEFD